MPRLLAALLLLLAACADSPAKEDLLYLAERANARGQPVFPPVALGLRLRLDSGRVARHLDSLRLRHQLSWPLRESRLPTQTEVHFDSTGHLVQLQLLLAADATPGGPAHQALQHYLRDTYGGNGFPHGRATGRVDSQSWFRGGTEITLRPHPALHVLALTYTDLPHTPPLPPEQLGYLEALPQVADGDTLTIW